MRLTVKEAIAALEASGFGPDRLAALWGVSPAYVGMLGRGKARPGTELAGKIGLLGGWQCRVERGQFIYEPEGS